MSVTAADLYHLGRSLIENTAEVDQRCGIGRLYYACFHLCDGFRIELERPLPADGGSHEAVAQALRKHRASTPQAEAVALNRIGARLDSLRTARHRADYRISEDLDPKDVALAPRLAEQIFGEVATFSAQHSLDGCASAARI